MSLTVHSSPQIVSPGKYRNAMGSFTALTKEQYKSKYSHERAQGLGLYTKDSKRVTSLDYFTNPAARMGWGTESLTEATQYELIRLSYDYWLMITLYTNHWICRKIIDIPASDMVRAWPRLTSDISPDDITLIDRAIRRTETKSKLLQTLKLSRLFGGAGALIIIDGQDHLLDQPLDLDTVELGSYRGIIPFDRWAGIQPSSNMCNDIRYPTRFNLPEYYEVQLPEGGSFKVHSSRVLRFTGPTVPTPEYEARQEWGISVIEPAFEELRKRDNMSWNLLCLSYRANLISMKIPDLAQMLSGASMTQGALVNFQQRMQTINAYMNSNNMMLLPENGEMSSTSYAPAGWADIYEQFQLDIAGAANIPVVKLFGRTANGLNQANDADLQLYYDKIGQEQDTDLRPQLETLYQVIAASELGSVPKDLDLIFPSARVMGEDEKASLAKNIGDLILGAAAGGIITRSMALKELKQSSDITGLFTNITEKDIQKAEEEEEQGLGQLGEQLGQAGGPQNGPPNMNQPKQEVNKQPELKQTENIESKMTSPQQEEKELISKKPEEPKKKGLVKTEESQSVKEPIGSLLTRVLTKIAEKENVSNVLAEQVIQKIETGNKIKKVLGVIKNKISQDSAGIKYISFSELPIGIEYEKGDRRIFFDDNNEVIYNVVCPAKYGFIQNIEGEDGDELDAIVGENENADNVWVVQMLDFGPDLAKRCNESKCMIGFDSLDSVKEVFFGFYPKNFWGGVVKVKIEEFRRSIRRGVL